MDLVPRAGCGMVSGIRLESVTVYFDTEDNSAELAAAARSGHEKVCTQIAAIASDGTKFYDRPRVRKKRKTSGGFMKSEWDVRPFQDWLAEMGPGVRVYAHNVAYDLGNIWQDNLDRFDVTMVGGRMITAKWANCKFLDSFNIWPMSLKKLGKSVGLEKLEFDSQDEQYLWRDVEIVAKAMEVAEMIADSHGVDLPSTLGGLCVRIWQAMGGANWHCALAPAREAYYGGRTEIFAPEMRGRILYTDVNSLYPSTMLLPFPDADDGWFDQPSLEDAKRILCDPTWDCWGVADVTLDIPQDLFVAPLPVRREDGAVWYPTGRVSGWWTVHEIRAAFQKGARLVELRDCYGSLSATNYYENFVLAAYRNRMETDDEGKRLFWKLVMNNLYGQIGQTGTVTRSVKLENHLREIDGQIYQTVPGTPYGSKLLTDIQTPLAAHVNWLHAAYVTSYGRLALMKYLDMVPKDDLVYCDTDSIFFRCRGEAPFPMSMLLGEMKLEDTLASMVVQQPKLYRYQTESGKTKTKAKGVPARGTLQEQFFDVGQATFSAPYKFRESVLYMSEAQANRITDSTRRLSVWREVTKRKITNYDKKDLRGGRYFPTFISS